MNAGRATAMPSSAVNPSQRMRGEIVRQDRIVLPIGPMVSARVMRVVLTASVREQFPVMMKLVVPKIGVMKRMINV